MPESAAMFTYGDGSIVLSPDFSQKVLQMLGDWYFLGCMIAVLLVLAIGLLCFIAFRMR